MLHILYYKGMKIVALILIALIVVAAIRAFKDSSPADEAVEEDLATIPLATHNDK